MVNKFKSFLKKCFWLYVAGIIDVDIKHIFEFLLNLDKIFHWLIRMDKI